MSYDLVVFDKDMAEDPGVITVAGTLAEGNREHDPILDRWDANFGGQTAKPSWAYIDARLSRQGLSDQDSFGFTVHHVQVSGTHNASIGLIGLHSDPGLAGPTDTDRNNFIGYKAEQGAGSNWRWYAYANDNIGNVTEGAMVESADFNVNVIVSYDKDTRLLSIEVRRFSDNFLIGSSSFTLPSDRQYLNLKKFATRDSPFSNLAIGITGYIADLKIEWLEIDEDWILYVVDQGCVILSDNSRNNKTQPPHETVISAEGRNWDNTYHDGAGPISIALDGILLRDLCNDFLEIEELVLPAFAQGTEVELHGYKRGYTMLNGKIAVWDMPAENARVDNRTYALVVKSKRKPQVS